MFTLGFWKAASERAVKTGAQFVLVILGIGLTGATGDVTVNAFLIDWPTLLGVFVGGVFVSYLTSLVSLGVAGSPSITRSEAVTGDAYVIPKPTREQEIDLAGKQ